jgi:hypothetical protein
MNRYPKHDFFKGLQSLLSLLLLLLAITGGTATAAEPTSSASVPGLGPILQLEVEHPQLAVNEEVTVIIAAENSKDLYAAEWRLSYDPAKLEVVEGSMKPIVWAEGYTQMIQTEGNLHFIGTKLGEGSGDSGRVELASVTFKAKALGQTSLKLEDSQGSNSLLQLLPFPTETLNLQVAEPDRSAPAKVTHVKDKESDEELLLTWNDPADADLWSIWVEVDGVRKAKVPPGTEQVLIQGLQAKTDYTATLYAVDKAGNKSEGVQVKVKTKQGSGKHVEQ